MVLNQDDAILECINTQADAASGEIPLGAKIIRAVRAYDAQTSPDSQLPTADPHEAIQQIRRDVTGGFNTDVVDALERCVCGSKRVSAAEPTLV
jgi:HD-GYP domain-containing protein (c-di-GMP phosphodiesterase class II)